MSKPLVIVGGGGHAGVLVDILRKQQRNILAVISPENLGSRDVFKGLMHLYNDDDVFQFDTNKVLLVNGIGMLPNSVLKRKLNQYYQSHGYSFETVIAGSAQVSPYAKIKDGVQIFSGAIVQAGTKIASHTVINTGAIVEHDCDIGAYNHLAPASLVCGQVKTAEGVYIGAGATIIQNITLDQDVIVGAGATVTRNMLAGQICYPARITTTNVKKIENKGNS